jgi:hypothetical protein
MRARVPYSVHASYRILVPVAAAAHGRTPAASHMQIEAMEPFVVKSQTGHCGGQPGRALGPHSPARGSPRARATGVRVW